MRGAMGLMFSVVALGLLQAQEAPAVSPLAVLKLVPASAESVELTWNLAESNPRYLKALQDFHERKGLVALGQIAHVELQDLAPGTVASINLPRTKTSTTPATTSEAASQSSRSAKAEKPSPSNAITYLPISGEKAFVARVHAKRTGNLWTFEWKEDSKTQKRYLAFRAGYALVAEQKAQLETALKPGPSLESELEPLNAWMLEQDIVVVASAQSTRLGIADVFSEPKDGKKPSPFSTKILESLGEKARGSIHHVGLGLKMPKEGGLQVRARAFFSAGSPLAADTSSLTPLSGHPLGCLPETPFALAMGGVWPRALNLLGRAESLNPAFSEADRATLEGFLSRSREQVRSMAFTFRGPERPGDPFLQGFSFVMDVKDAKAWMEANRAQITWMGERLQGAYAVQPDCLPDHPSFTLDVDLATLLKGQFPSGQVAVVGGLLLGGSHFRLSYAALDEHTILCAVGGSENLKALLAKAGEGKPLAARPTVRAVDGLLPKDRLLAMYLDPAGLQQLVLSLVQAFSPGKLGGLKTIGSVPPLAAVLSLDPAGIQLTGAATPESLEAMARAAEGMKTLFAKKSAEAMEGSDEESED